MKLRVLRRLLCVLTVPVTGAAYAGGFQLFEHSAKHVGAASANLAEFEDAMAAIDNPAAMTALQGRQFSVHGAVIKVTGRFADAGSRTFLPPPGGLPLSGGDGGDPGSYEPVASLAYVHPLSDRLRAGVAVFAPFGLSTDFEPGWQGRYYALYSDVRSLDINPMLAYRVNDKISIGAGISARYLKATLSNAVDFSTLCLAQSAINPALMPLCAGAGLTLPGNATTDGEVRLKGDDWSLGWNVGVAMQLTEATTFSFAYRSRVAYVLKGSARTTLPVGLPAVLGGLPSFQPGGVQARLSLPETASAAFTTRLDPQWSVSGSVIWTGWSRLQEFRGRFDNGAPDAVLPLRYGDSWRAAIGAAFKANERWTWRAGLAYDDSPVSTAFRTPRLPDAKRIILGIGASVRLDPQASLDLAYSHLRFDDAPIALNGPEGQLQGSFPNGKGDVVSVQYNRRF